MLGRRELVSNPGHPGCNPRDSFDRLAHLFRNPVGRQRLSSNFQDVIPQTGKTGPTISVSIRGKWVEARVWFAGRTHGNIDRHSCGVKSALDSCSRAESRSDNYKRGFMALASVGE